MVLAIAGSDPSGAAGLQLDFRVIAALGARSTSVVAVHTVQDEGGLQSATPVAGSVVRAMIDAAFAQHSIAAVKIGALGNAEVVEAVSAALSEQAAVPVVCDPVGAATKARAGVHLLEPGAWPAMRTQLLPLCALVTPNISEAEALSETVIDTDAGLDVACERILALGAKAVLLKGGHWQLDGPQVRDLLMVAGEGSSWLESERLPDGTEIRGTGCALSSAIAVFLAQGASVRTACLEARSALLRWMHSATNGRLDPTP